jgi:hypothetical protein
MKRRLISAVLLAMAAVLLAACSAGGAGSGSEASGITLPAPADSPAGMPARPGSGVSGDPSVNLDDRQEVSGVVKEVNGDLVLIGLAGDGGDFMLRFSENSTWCEGVSQDITVGNTIRCTVKPEPTSAPPSQGEVKEVLLNEVAK